MHVGFARVIWAEYIAGYFITDRRSAPELLQTLTIRAEPFKESETFPRNLTCVVKEIIDARIPSACSTGRFGESLC